MKKDDEKNNEENKEEEIELTDSMKNEAIAFVNDTFKSIFETKKMNI